MQHMSLQEAKNYQTEMARRVIRKNHLPDNLSTIAGVDVSYSKRHGFGVAVVLDYETLDVIEVKKISREVSFPYVPGYFMLREAGPVVSVLRKLENSFDVLLVDGNGILHPREFGLACLVGLEFEKPTVGVAKKLLCGSVRANSNIVSSENKTLGCMLTNHVSTKTKSLYVSVGHKVDLNTAVKITKKATKSYEVIPEPIRLADKLSREYRKLKIA